MSLLQRSWRDLGPRTHHYDVFCTNPACPHSRRPHPIQGSVDSYGGTIWPGSATPTECPACDAELDTRPLFEADEEYISEEWE
jgi:hypothetical protein